MANMKTTLQAAGLLALCTVLGTAPIAAFAYTGQQLASEAKLSIGQARAIALKARPGNITDQELVKESGGSGLRYSFDIKSGAKTYDVGVDAQSGAVLENKAEASNAN
jgi:uncharacterized membrane protein YkoI